MVNLPNSLITIDSAAFSGCSGLTSVFIPNSVTSIGGGAFSGCSGLASVTIPNSVTSIGGEAFFGCSGLTSVTIPNSVTSIGWSTFRGCSGLTSITIPNSVTSIGESDFYGCSGLTSVTIPNSVTNIGWGAFYGCSGLTSVTIPNSVTNIEARAFYGCSGLTSVTIGNSVTSIGNYVFSGCSGLTSIVSRAAVPPTIFGNTFNGVNSSINITIPCGSLPSYSTQWSYFTNFIDTISPQFVVMSSNLSRGDIDILMQPTCQSPIVTFFANPVCNYQFDHWSDGDTTNPRTLTLTSDTVLIGYFVSATVDTVFVHDTSYVNIYDTNYINVHDTTYINVPYPIHDTTYVGLPYPVHDTTYVNIFVHDTTLMMDTLWMTLHDTVFYPQYIHDTIFLPQYIHDSTYILQEIHDTIYLPQYIHDTIIIHDTIYITQEGIESMDVLNAKIYSSQGQIVVECGDGMPLGEVRVFDAVGRAIRHSELGIQNSKIRIDVPVSGTYLIKIGDHPARKVVVIR